MLKLYVEGNYFFAVDDSNNEIECFKSEAKIERSKTYSTQYTITFGSIGKRTVEFADLRDENDDPFASQDAFKTWYTANTGFNTASGGSEATTAVVNISSAQILEMGTTPIELLPAPGANSYYDVNQIILEYTHVETAYTNAVPLTVYQTSGKYFGSTFNNLITAANSTVTKMIEQANYLQDSLETNTLLSDLIKINDNYVLTTQDSSNPTLGDGTLRAIITYTVRTFGA